MHSGRINRKPSLHPAGRESGGGRPESELNSIQEAEEFAAAAQDFAPLINDINEYAALLLDVAEDGRINHPERRAKAERLKDALEMALV